MTTVAQPLRRSARSMVRQWWLWCVLGVVAIVVGGIATAPKEPGEDLDPTSASPNGAKAVVQVLRQHGIDVTIVHHTDEIPRDLGDDTTLAIISSVHIGMSDITDAVNRTPGVRRVVVSNSWMWEPLGDAGISASPVPYEEETITAGVCATDVFGTARTLEGIDAVIDNTMAPMPNARCFSNASGAAVAVWGATAERAEVVMLSSDKFIRNDTITKADNAAAALALFGATPKVVWYFAAPSDPDFSISPADRGVWRILPTWVFPVGYLLGAIVILFMIYRGRRFGRLAVEKLPVSVRPSETTLALGRALESSGASATATVALVEQAKRQMKRALRLSSLSSEDDLIGTIVHFTGREEGEVRRILTPQQTTSKQQIVVWANELTALVEEVHHGTAAATRH